ncbi:MAG: lipopolysaccharide biosynthesis protein [Bacteroidota bacterium]
MSDARTQFRTFWQHVLTLATGAALAQALSVLALPVLSRLYLLDSYGWFGTYLAVVFVLQVLVNGGYEVSIVLPSEDQSASQLLRLSQRICWAITGGLLLVLWALEEVLLPLFQWEELQGWHMLWPLSLWLEGQSQALIFALNRQKRYAIISAAKVTRTSVTIGLSIILGLQEDHFSGLIMGYVAGQAAYFLTALLYYRQPFPRGKQNLSATSKAYEDFPRYAILSTWANNTSRYLPFFLLPGYYSASVNGLFTKAEKILNIPSALVGMSIGQVFYQQASRAWEESPAALRSLTRRTFLQLLVLALPFLLVIMWWGPDLFAWVLGEPWREAGIYARWLMPWMFFAFMAGPLSFLVDVRRKLKVFLYFNLALLLVRLVVLVWAGTQWTALATVQAFGVAGAVMVAGQLIYLLYLGGLFLGKEKRAD